MVYIVKVYRLSNYLFIQRIKNVSIFYRLMTTFLRAIIAATITPTHEKIPLMIPPMHPSPHKKLVQELEVFGEG